MFFRNQAFSQEDFVEVASLPEWFTIAWIGIQVCHDNKTRAVGTLTPGTSREGFLELGVALNALGDYRPLLMLSQWLVSLIYRSSAMASPWRDSTTAEME
jgi:hypothetical protein